MKTLCISFKHGLRLLVLSLGLVMCQNLLAAVGFTITPSTVSNTFSSIIILRVTGLSAGETVTVQKYLDANANGFVDEADTLWQQFQLTDGEQSVIGGIVDVNVPGDTDTVPGQITSRLGFQAASVLHAIIGKYAYKLSSPTGRFAPLISAFEVTNSSFAQSLNGKVVNDGTNVANAIVLLLAPPRSGDSGSGQLLAGTVADNTGYYSINVPAGAYVEAAVKRNYVGHLGGSSVSVGSGLTTTAEVTVSNATQTISGRVVDTANTTIGLAGLFLHVIADESVGIGSTDENGNFAIGVVPGHWNLGEDGTEVLGYLSMDSDNVVIDTTTGSVNGLTIAYPKATALFYGSVINTHGQPLAGVSLYSYGNNDLHNQDTFTDENGYYVLGALGGESWGVGVDSDQPVLTNYLFSLGYYDTNLSAGQAVLQDFTAIPATNHLTGHVQDNVGNDITNVEIYAYASGDGMYYDADADTDANGDYSLNVANGTWHVNVSYGGGDHSLSNIYLPPASQTVGITNNDATVDFTVLIAPYHITGSVKDDNNNPLPNVNVYASANVDGRYYYQQSWTDSSGNFTVGVLNGSWNVRVCCDCDGWPSGLCCPGTQSINISNANAVADFAAPGQIVITTPAPLPDGYVGEYYSTTLDATACSPSVYWSGSNLPSGFDLSWPGYLYGTPETPGTNDFLVRVDDGSGGFATKHLTLLVHPATTGGVVAYYVSKLSGYRQTNALNVVPDSVQGPYNAYLGVIQESLGLISNATCTLPAAVVKTFPSAYSALELQVHDAFTNESAFDAAYPPGDYSFAMYTLNDGNQFPILHLSPTAPPNAPRISNYVEAQAIDPRDDFELQWDALSGGTNDFIWLTITDSSEVPPLKLWDFPEPVFEAWPDISATSEVIPAGTLQPGRNYLGVLQVYRLVDVNETAYPGAYGEADIGVQTAFSLTTKTVAPMLVPWNHSAAQFSFVLAGIAGQNYTIQKSTNLNPPHWSVLLVTNAPADFILIVDPLAGSSSAYYRALSGP